MANWLLHFWRNSNFSADTFIKVYFFAKKIAIRSPLPYYFRRKPAIWTNFKPLENGSVTFKSFLYLIGFLVFLLFVLIIAMGKVKPSKVSDYQGEITNNNNHRQLPCTVLINWLPRNSSVFCEPIRRIRVFQKGNCSLEFQIWSTIIYLRYYKY